METKIRLGDLLVQNKVITRRQLDDALSMQHETGEPFGKILIKTGVVEEKIFLNYLAKKLEVPFVDLANYQFDKALAIKLPESHARLFHAILLGKTTEGYLVGIVDPSDIFAVDELRHVLEGQIKLALVSEQELLRTFDMIYRRSGEINDFAERLDDELEKTEAKDEMNALKQADTAVIRLINSLFEDAVQINASDIHIEPDKQSLRIRMRVDGVLQEQIIDEKRIANALSQRLKLMSGLNMAERRLPQDGRFSITVRGMLIDVRLSTMPVQYGESIVMRLLNQAQGVLELDTVGMNKEMLEQFRRLVHIPSGIVLVTGPTGSGKTTTLYGALSEINDIGKKIITIEDPVEYRISRLNQIQVNTALDLTFSRVLRSSLRQDPDIILIGEIRDQESVAIALRAALTGHLVLATLHTNDAASAAVRLIDMGAEGYLVAATVRAALAQRLVRKICKNCVTSYKPTAQEQSFFLGAFGDEYKKSKFKIGKGCAHCNHTGFSGRQGIFELLEFDPPMLEALRQNNTAKFGDLAEENEANSLLQNAFTLAKEGVTTLSEVLRVAGERG